MRNLAGHAARVIALLLPLVLCPPGEAGEERYDYDPLGRLIRVIDGQGRATAYTYDAAGNLLRVVTAEADQAPPVVTSVAPDFVRAGTDRELRLIGSGLLGAKVGVDADLSARVIAAAANELTVRLTASADAVLGPRAVRITNPAGFTEAAISVRPALTFTTIPTRIVIPPDSMARFVAVRMSDTDPQPVSLAFSLSRPSVASVSPDAVVIESGQIEAQVTITGWQEGDTHLDISSPVLAEPARFHVVVSNDALNRSAPLGVWFPPPPAQQGPLSFWSSDLGVFFEEASLQGVNIIDVAGTDLGVLVQPADFPQTVERISPLLGVVSGAVSVTSLSPNGATPGTAFTLSIRGINFFDSSAVIVEPPDGITLTSVPSVTADGMQITVDISIESAAIPSARVIRVVTPRGTSPAEPMAGNTFTINTP